MNIGTRPLAELFGLLCLKLKFRMQCVGVGFFACVFQQALFLFCISHLVFEDGLPLLAVGHSRLWIDMKKLIYLYTRF